MNLFNQNYYIQIRMCKLEKKKQKLGVQKNSMESSQVNIYKF